MNVTYLINKVDQKSVFDLLDVATLGQFTLELILSIYLVKITINHGIFQTIKMIYFL